ncbi:MAG: hypothetical protein CVT99_12685 [Bacteroidetes bacterium HGW-Bacteroidetes-16]|jgi:hypothetical protein|nr:MAG: hypothetical protein CVT99_12685 [Bacteroidetes bacterium HGW-Bacteroidetes-16]
MKALGIISLILLVTSLNTSCLGQTQPTESTTLAATKTVQVYYFHFSRRCTTCKAVEAESKKAVEELFGNKVLFAAYDMDEPDGEKKAEDLGIEGQTLIIYGGNTKIDLTNEGFMYAVNKPEKLKEIFKEKITPLL